MCFEMVAVAFLSGAAASGQGKQNVVSACFHHRHHGQKCEETRGRSRNPGISEREGATGDAIVRTETVAY